jgi:hypothetical protein
MRHKPGSLRLLGKIEGFNSQDPWNKTLTVALPCEDDTAWLKYHDMQSDNQACPVYPPIISRNLLAIRL